MFTFVKKKYASVRIKALHREHAMRATAKGMRGTADWLNAKAFMLEDKANAIEQKRAIKDVVGVAKDVMEDIGLAKEIDTMMNAFKKGVNIQGIINEIQASQNKV